MGYLSPKEYAERWHLSYSHVWRCVHNGRLRAFKIGKHTYRIRADEVISPDVPPKVLVRFDFKKELAAL